MVDDVPLRYIPKRLTRKDRGIIRRELRKSRKAYKRGLYVTRRPVKSYKHKTSKHVRNAKRLYKIKGNLSLDSALARKTGCSMKALNKIFKKGQGAYFSSGSRPNQTAHSWAYARLASAITGSKAAAVDFKILEKGCKKTSKAYRLALRRYRKGVHGVPKVRL